MLKKTRQFYSLILITLTMLTAQAAAQSGDSDKSKPAGTGKPVMWEQVDPSTLDLYWGPGGEAMKPDLSKITLIDYDFRTFGAEAARTHLISRWDSEIGAMPQ